MHAMVLFQIISDDATVTKSGFYKSGALMHLARLTKETEKYVNESRTIGNCTLLFWIWVF